MGIKGQTKNRNIDRSLTYDVKETADFNIGYSNEVWRKDKSASKGYWKIAPENWKLQAGRKTWSL